MISTLSYPERIRVEEIYSRTKNIVFGVARQILCNNSLAEEVLQETFSRLIKNISAIDTSDERKITNYLITTARYIAFDIYNREHREAPGFDEDISEREEDQAEDFIFAVENKAVLKGAIAKLPEELKTALLLYYAQGYRQEEIAKMLGISRSLVSARLIKAKKLLKKEITEKGELDL